MKRALVTINYNEALGDNSRRSMEAACARWGIEFMEITGANHRIHSPASMKTLVFSEIGPDLDEALILDADTVIRSDTPNPFELFAADAFIVVENGGARFGDQAQILGAEKYEWGKVTAWHAQPGLPAWRGCIGTECREVMPYFNSGMMIVRRPVHVGLLGLAEECCRHDLGLGWHDQTPLNFYAAWLVKAAKLNVNFADETWNYIHPEHCLGPDWRNMKKFIYHFAGTCGRRELIEQVRWEV